MGKSKLEAIIGCRCPQCREGKVFKKGPFNLKNVISIHQHCTVCNFRFEVEPGFFWAAMYISYAVNAAIVVGLFLGINLLTETREPWHFLVPIILAVLLPMPFTLRYSRIILLHFFSGAKYKKNDQANSISPS